MKIYLTILLTNLSFMVFSQTSLENFIYEKYKADLEYYITNIIDSSLTSSEIDTMMKEFIIEYTTANGSRSVKVHNNTTITSPQTFPSITHYLDHLYSKASKTKAECIIYIDSIITRRAIVLKNISRPDMLFIKAKIEFVNARIKSKDEYVLIENIVEIEPNTNFNIDRIYIDKISKYDSTDKDQDGIIDMIDYCLSDIGNKKYLKRISEYGCLDKDQDGYFSQVNTSIDNPYRNLHDPDDLNKCIPDSSSSVCQSNLASPRPLQPKKQLSDTLTTINKDLTKIGLYKHTTGLLDSIFIKNGLVMSITSSGELKITSINERVVDESFRRKYPHLVKAVSIDDEKNIKVLTQKSSKKPHKAYKVDLTTFSEEEIVNPSIVEQIKNTTSTSKNPNQFLAFSKENTALDINTNDLIFSSDRAIAMDFFNSKIYLKQRNSEKYIETEFSEEAIPSGFVPVSIAISPDYIIALGSQQGEVIIFQGKKDLLIKPVNYP